MPAFSIKQRISGYSRRAQLRSRMARVGATASAARGVLCVGNIRQRVKTARRWRFDEPASPARSAKGCRYEASRKREAWTLPRVAYIAVAATAASKSSVSYSEE